MKETGNPHQWKDISPTEEQVKEDIKRQNCYLIVDDNNHIFGVFALLFEDDPTYTYIEGKWLNDEKYGVIHRIASSLERKEVLKTAIDYAFSNTNNVRIDTHKDNHIMQHLLEKYGFQKCGIIYLLNGETRIAYHKKQNELYN